MKNAILFIFIFCSIRLHAQSVKNYDETESIEIRPNGEVKITETKLSPAQVRVKYKSSAGGACKGFSYKVHSFNNKLYYFLSKDISGQLSKVKKDLSEVTSYFKYYKADKCLVVRLNDERDSRNLQGYFTEMFCQK
jgi:hypothetical protein